MHKLSTLKKILIADDHQIIRTGITLFLETNFTDIQIDLTENYFETKTAIASKIYDLLILDIDMPGTKYTGMIQELKLLQPTLKILVFSGYEERIGVQYILEGANGYLEKTVTEQNFVIAIESIIESGHYYTPEQMTLLSHQIKKINPLQQLSEREMEVYQLLVKGNGNLEISNILNLKISTVSTYKKRIFEKLNIKNLIELLNIQKEIH